ncbi:M20/M25/M40 family metallo-hydrolase [Paracoccaceae bacterium]|nr:M20/M25/M40 family metallo-hydrolase [Paracoccaceae bacterium]
MSTLEQALKLSKKLFVDGIFFEQLRNLVQIVTDSKNSRCAEDLVVYYTRGLSNILTELGIQTEIVDNPVKNSPPFLIGSRMESPELKTILLYGHGDTVPLQEGQWNEGISPSDLKIIDDKIYGRGVADNKGQHLINLLALHSVLRTRTKLGFNLKIFFEMGEEIGSPGLCEFCEAYKEYFISDVLIASDGPRVAIDVPTIFLGSRGALNFELEVNYRSGAHHSGNWGGVLSDPGIRLSNALSTIADKNGKILIDNWKPTSLTSSVRERLNLLPNTISDTLDIDENWGEPGLSSNEKLFGWNSFSILALKSGNIDVPVNAIQPSAKALCQLRFVVGTNANEVISSLRDHLDQQGFTDVKIITENAINFQASRTDLNNVWLQKVENILEKFYRDKIHVIPNLAGSLPNNCFTDILEIPTIWIPHSYKECSQHAPNEHLPINLLESSLLLMTNLYWNLGISDHKN